VRHSPILPVSALAPARTTLAIVNVSERIEQERDRLTPAERRVASIILDRPQLVAFGTIADLSAAASAGAATVVRCANKLGLDGFTGMQASVQRDLAAQLRPAAERIREPAATDALERHLQTEVDNVAATLHAVDADALADVVIRIADDASRVFVLSGDASAGIAHQMVGELRTLRDRVDLIGGNDVAVQRAVSLLASNDVVVAIDLRRYDRWLVEAAQGAAERGVFLVAITDSLLSPLASLAQRTFTVSAAGVGVFDSHVGTLALSNLLVAGVADRRRAQATDRLDRAEAAWQTVRALITS